MLIGLVANRQMWLILSTSTSLILLFGFKWSSLTNLPRDPSSLAPSTLKQTTSSSFWISGDVKAVRSNSILTYTTNSTNWKERCKPTIETFQQGQKWKHAGLVCTPLSSSALQSQKWYEVPLVEGFFGKYPTPCKKKRKSLCRGQGKNNITWYNPDFNIIAEAQNHWLLY